MEKLIAWVYANKIIAAVIVLGLLYAAFGGSGEFAGFPIGDK